MSNINPHHPTTKSPESSATELQNPFYGQMRFSLPAFVILAAIATVFLVLSRSSSPLASQIFLLIGVFFAIAAAGFGVVLPMMWVQARRTNRAFDAIRHGQFYVRWEYPRDFWYSWISWRSAQIGNTLGMVVIVLLAAIPVILLAMHWYADANHLNNSARQAQAVVLIPITFFAGVFSVCWFLARLKRNTALTNPPFIAYVSKTAVYLHGNVDLLIGGMGDLETIKITPTDPARIEFRFRQTTQTGNRYFTRLVPIPPGKLEIAERVVATLRREYFDSVK
jgi:hypothetical protein